MSGTCTTNNEHRGSKLKTKLKILSDKPNQINAEMALECDHLGTDLLQQIQAMIVDSNTPLEPLHAARTLESVHL